MRTAPLQTGALALLLGFAPVLAPIESSLAQDVPPESPAPKASTVVATVNGKPIYVAQVDAILASLMKAQHTNQVSLQARAMSLRQIINRTLAAQALERDGSYVTEAEIDKAIDAIKAQAKDQNQTLEEYVARQGATMDTVHHELLWQLGWPRYLERHLTDGLEAFFNSHRRDFDGTEIRASHILLRPSGPAIPPKCASPGPGKSATTSSRESSPSSRP